MVNSKQKEYSKKWYDNNKELQMERVRKRIKELREFCTNYKVSRGCCCGERHPACLELHHRDAKTKEINPSHMARRGWSISRIEKELEKCDVLCSNCHKKLHYEQATIV